MSKYEADLRLLAPRLIANRHLIALLKAHRWDDAESALSGELGPLAVDFLQVYEEKDNTWQLRAETSGASITPPGAFSNELMRRALESGIAIRSEAGYVALPFDLEGRTRTAADSTEAARARETDVSAAAGAGDTSERIILVAGYWLGEDFFVNVREVSDGLLYYGQLEVFKRVAKQSVWITAAILFGVAAIVLLIVAAFLARRLSKPILGLTDGMKRVAAGRLDEKVTVKATGEIKYLVDSFNTMIQDLRLYKEQLARAERIAAWQDVARYVAHEIRNPLTPIKVSLHRLRSCVDTVTEGEKKRLSDSIDAILNEVTSLERLATAFSEFAKLPEPVPLPVDVNKIIRELAELYEAPGEEPRQEPSEAGGPQLEPSKAHRPQPKPSEAGRIKITLALEESLPLISADAQQIRMALQNIMKNAAEAMPEGGVLEIRSRRIRADEVYTVSPELGPMLHSSVFDERGKGGEIHDSGRAETAAADRAGAHARVYGARETSQREGGFIEITFRDTGSGIPEPLLTRITAPHFTTKKGGTGLGLTVVSKVISQHGGRFLVQSREGKGTLVRIVLPAMPRGDARRGAS